MSSTRTYLDYNATAPLRPAARVAMLAALEAEGNPSSVHAEGRRARDIVETAREQVAQLVHAKAAEVVFTSGAAEANAWALSGPWRRVIVSRLEHESILAALARPDSEVVEVPVGASGQIEAGVMIDRVTDGSVAGPALVVLQAANNETGVVQPVADIAQHVSAHGLAMHCDAVQAIGRVAVDFDAIGCSFMSLSAHKIGGPKGIGALVIRDGTALAPLIPGGQERRRRGGTENVAAIAGFGAAAADAAAGLSATTRIATLRDRLERQVHAFAPNVVIVGERAPRLPNTSCLALSGHRAETLVIRLDLMGFAVSAGAACSSGKVGTSHVLAAMGLDPGVARGAIRISLGEATTEADIDALLGAICEIAAGRTDRGLTLRV